jgi:hypothetical protein
VHCTYKVSQRRVRLANVGVEYHQLLRNLSVCLYPQLSSMHNALFLCRIILQSVACLALLPFFALFLIKDRISENIYWTRNVFWISLQILSETLFILIKIQPHITVTVPAFYCKLLAFFSEFNYPLNIWQIFENSSYTYPLSVKFWDWVCKKYKIQPHNKCFQSPSK